LISGIDCAMAGAAMVAAPATPMPVTLIKSLRFIELVLLWGVGSLRFEACRQHGTFGCGLSTTNLVVTRESPALKKAGLP
jgi:hypothetical protein